MTEAERNALIEAHVGLVKVIARKLMRRLPPWVEVDDMIQHGMLGLIDAAARFDASHGVAFGAFAQFRIRGAIKDHYVGRNYPQAHLSLDATAERQEKIEPEETWNLERVSRITLSVAPSALEALIEKQQAASPAEHGSRTIPELWSSSNRQRTGRATSFIVAACAPSAARANSRSSSLPGTGTRSM